ncbi:hypothetical protein [Nocardioides nanhaiensis]|uniref:Uncharacterized protein n=1 Tax=Nocardioides nanhaiensis TaxID=1476871 RepID=A0ABP8W327_9ACTN
MRLRAVALQRSTQSGRAAVVAALVVALTLVLDGATVAAADPDVSSDSAGRQGAPAFVDLVASGPEEVFLLREDGLHVDEGTFRGVVGFTDAVGFAGATDLALVRADDDVLLSLPGEQAVQRYDPVLGAQRRWDLGAGTCPTRAADLGSAMLLVSRCEADQVAGLVLLDRDSGQVTPLAGAWTDPELVPDAVDAAVVHVVETAAGAGRAVRYRLGEQDGLLVELARRDVPGQVVEAVGDAAQGGRLQIVTRGPDAVLTLDARTLEQVARTAVPDVHGVAADGDLTVVAHGDSATLMAPGYRAPLHLPRPGGAERLATVVRGGSLYQALLDAPNDALWVERSTARFGSQVRLSSSLVGPYTSPEWGRPVTFDVGLNSLSLERTVEVYARSEGVRRLLGTVEVPPGRAGHLTTRLRGATDVEAVYTGGAHSEPSRAELAVPSLRAALSTRLSGHVGRRGRTYLYRVGSVAVTHTRVGPARDGRCVRHQAQYFDRGLWETFSRTTCLRTNARGVATSRLGSNESYLGHRIRIQIEVGSDRVTQGNGLVRHLRYLPARPR